MRRQIRGFRFLNPSPERLEHKHWFFFGQLQSLDADGDSSSLWCVVAYKQTHRIHFSLTAYLYNVQKSIRNTRTGPAAKSSNNEPQPD